MIPAPFIQDLLGRIDIVDLIDSHIPLKKAGANFVACCPFHSEKTPSFTVSHSKQFYHCFGCGAHGTAINFLMEYSGAGFVEAVKDLAKRAGMQVPSEEERSSFTPHQHDSLADVMVKAAKYYYARLKESAKAINYLKGRGISGEIVQKYRIGYAPSGWQNLENVFQNYAQPELQQAGLVVKQDTGRLHDRFRDRIMFPIINTKGEVIAFGGRILNDGEPKYLNSPETPLFEKGREVFGQPQALAALRKKNTVVVVEGYMDVIALAQHGIENVVAALGTATTGAHVQKLLRQADQIVFCFDGDSAGKKAAWRALENSLPVLPEQKRIDFVFLPPTEDPDSYVRRHGVAAFENLVRQSTPLSDFLIQELVSHGNMNTAEGRAGLISKAKPLLVNLKSPSLRLQLIKRLAEISKFTQQEVENLCELKPITQPSPPRLPRQAPPSLLRHLLRLLLQKPELAEQVPLETLPKDSSEAEAVNLLCEAILSFNGALPNHAVLLERLRECLSEPVLSKITAELIESTLVENEIDSEFEGVIHRLLENEKRRSFALLQEKVKKLGIASLSDEEKQRYQQYLQELSFQHVSRNVKPS